MRDFVWLFLLVNGFASVSGCGDKIGSAIRVSPENFNFGVVAANGQDINAVIQVRNHGDMATNVKVRPTCGCITMMDKFSLEPGEIRKVPFVFSSIGKTGNFHAEVGFVVDGTILSVPIDVLFEPEVHVFPTRVVLLPGKDGSFTGEFRLRAPESLMSNLQFEVTDGVKVERVAPEEGGAPDSQHARYRVVASNPLSRVFTPIRVKKKSQESPVLSIPIILSAPLKR